MMLCECGRPAENKDTGECATCGAARRKAERMHSREKKLRTPIAKASKKAKSSSSEYSKLKAKFIIDKVCPIYPFLKVVDIHHMKGRSGFADQWARDNGITLQMDVRFWLAVSRKGHMKIELQPQWAKNNHYSLSRTEIIEEQNPKQTT